MEQDEEGPGKAEDEEEVHLQREAAPVLVKNRLQPEAVPLSYYSGQRSGEKLGNETNFALSKSSTRPLAFSKSFQPESAPRARLSSSVFPAENTSKAGSIFEVWSIPSECQTEGANHRPPLLVEPATRESDSARTQPASPGKCAGKDKATRLRKGAGGRAGSSAAAATSQGGGSSARRNHDAARCWSKQQLRLQCACCSSSARNSNSSRGRLGAGLECRRRRGQSSQP
eukprot:1024749-Rhodomonas_salina.2